MGGEVGDDERHFSEGFFWTVGGWNLGLGKRGGRWLLVLEVRGGTPPYPGLDRSGVMVRACMRPRLQSVRIFMYKVPEQDRQAQSIVNPWSIRQDFSTVAIAPRRSGALGPFLREMVI